MSQGYDGAVKIKVEVDTEQSKKDFSTVEKQAEQAGQAAATSYSKAGKSAEDAGKGFGKLQSSATSAAVAVGRGGTVATTTAASIARQTATIAKQTLAYNSVTKAAQEAAIAEQAAAQSQVKSLSDRLTAIAKKVSVYRSTVAEIEKDKDTKWDDNRQNVRKDRLEKIAKLEKESVGIAKELGKANDVLAVSTGKANEVLKKQIGIIPALKNGFSSLLNVMGGIPGLITMGLVAAFSYFAGTLNKSKKDTYAFSASLEGVYGSAEEARKGISKLRQEIAEMSQAQAAFNLGKMEKQLKKLKSESEALMRFDFKNWGVFLDPSNLKGFSDNVFTQAVKGMRDGTVAAKDFEAAIYEAANQNIIDDEQKSKLLDWGKEVTATREGIVELGKRAAGAGSSVSEMLRQIDEAARPQNLKDAYEVFNRYIDSQDKGKKTATDAAKESAKLAVARMREASATELAAGSAAKLAETQARASGSTKEAERFSKLAEEHYTNAARLLRDAQALEVKIPEIKLGGASSTKKELTDMSVFLEKFKSDLAALRGESGADYTKGLQDGLKSLRSELKNVKGATKEVREEFEKDYAMAFAEGKIREFTDNLDRLEGRGYEVSLREAAKAAEEFKAALVSANVTEEEAAKISERYKAALEHEVNTKNLEEQLSFLKEAAQLSGNYGMAIETQNKLIEDQAKRYRTLFENKPELLEMVDIWERLSKLEISDKWEDGFSRAAKKYSAEWTNAAKVAEQTFDVTISGMENIGMSAFDALFDNAEFRADQLLKDMARQLYQIGMRSAIGSLFSFGLPGKMSGGYTGDGPTNEPAAIAHGQEYVLNAAATKSIGVGTLNALNSGAGLSALSSLSSSSWMRGIPQKSSAITGDVSVQIIDQRSTKSEPVQVQETRSADGMRQIRVLIRDEVTSNINRRGDIYKAIGTQFNVSPARRGY